VVELSLVPLGPRLFAALIVLELLELLELDLEPPLPLGPLAAKTVEELILSARKSAREIPQSFLNI
jgi:hypothetical protein